MATRIAAGFQHLFPSVQSQKTKTAKAQNQNGSESKHLDLRGRLKSFQSPKIPNTFRTGFNHPFTHPQQKWLGCTIPRCWNAVNNITQRIALEYERNWYVHYQIYWVQIGTFTTVLSTGLSSLSNKTASTYHPE